jgi:hypothetical protein
LLQRAHQKDAWPPEKSPACERLALALYSCSSVRIEFNAGVGEQPAVLEAPGLDLASGGDALAHGCRGLSGALARQFLVVDARDIHVDVDVVEQWRRDALLIARDDGWGAGAILLRILEIAAWAGMNTKRTFYPIVYGPVLLDRESYSLSRSDEDELGTAQAQCPIRGRGDTIQ